MLLIFIIKRGNNKINREIERKKKWRKEKGELGRRKKRRRSIGRRNKNEEEGDVMRKLEVEEGKY